MNTPIVGPMGIINLDAGDIDHALAVTNRHPGVRLYA